MKQIAGKRFGRLLAIEETIRTIDGSPVWVFDCDCGTTVEIPISQVTVHRKRSCGCDASSAEAVKIKRPRRSKVDKVKRGRGRPEIAECDRLGRIVRARMTSTETAAMMATAKRLGITESVFIRDAIREKIKASGDFLR